jgi:hypothetical protein
MMCQLPAKRGHPHQTHQIQQISQEKLLSQTMSREAQKGNNTGLGELEKPNWKDCRLRSLSVDKAEPT